MGERDQAKERLKQYEQFLRNQLSSLQAPDPFLNKLMGYNQGILDWHMGTGGPKDIYKHPSIASKLPIFELAKRNTDAGRIGRGVVGSTNMNKSQYAEDLKMEDDFNRNIEAAGLLEQGLRGEQDKALNSSMQIWGLNNDRLGQANSLLGELYKLDYERANKPSGKMQFLRGALGGVAQGLIGLI